MFDEELVTIPLSEQSLIPWHFLGVFYDYLVRTVDGGILNVLDIFEMLLPPVLRPKIFPRSASVNSEPFGIVNDNKSA